MALNKKNASVLFTLLVAPLVSGTALLAVSASAQTPLTLTREGAW